MYAIIEDGGHQHKVQQGQELRVDYREAPKGQEIRFERVLAVSSEDGVKLGKPLLDGAVVTAEVLGVTQGEKLVVQKLRRRKNTRRKTGHRQLYTTVRVSKIEG